MNATDNRKRATPRYEKGTIIALVDCPRCGKTQPAYLDKKGKIYHGCHLPRGCGYRSHWGRNDSDAVIDEWEGQPASNDNTRTPANDNETTAQQIKGSKG